MAERTVPRSHRKRIGLIGPGMAITPHARSALDLSGQVEIAFAFSSSGARRRSFAQRFPFPLWDSLDTLLADVLVDAVAVLTPPHTHLDIVSRCAVAGKHVLLEKPLEITTARAQALAAACRGARVAPGIVPQHSRKPAVLIDSARSGTPVGSGPAARNR